MMKKRPFSRVLSLKNGLFLVEVRRLELRASWSQRNPEYLFPLIFSRFRPFPLENTSFPALLPPLFPCTPVVSVGQTVVKQNTPNAALSRIRGVFCRLYGNSCSAKSQGFSQSKF